MHGGGYIVGTARADYHGVGFAEHAGCTVVSVDYRLAPESTYKDSIADCFAALNWMVETHPHWVLTGSASRSAAAARAVA